MLAATAADKKLSASSLSPAAQLQDMETMEVHVYRCLEKKYGLRSLAVEHSAMFLRGLRVHALDHVDVEVFLKIFNNEVEEGFVKVRERGALWSST